MMETTFSVQYQEKGLGPFFSVSKSTDVLLGQYCAPYPTPTNDFFTLVKFQFPSSAPIPIGLYDIDIVV